MLVGAMSERDGVAESSAAASHAGAGTKKDGWIMVMWGGRCPMGSQCSKRGSTLKNCSSYEEAEATIVHHLMSSPYHELTREEAEAAVDPSLISSWEVTFDENDQWLGSKRGGGTGTRVAPPREHLQPNPPDHPPPGHTIERRKRPRSSTSTSGTREIRLSEVQLGACVDSLRRARIAAESAGQLCAKAARAFHEEASCIGSCVEVLESYMPRDSSSSMAPRGS